MSPPQDAATSRTALTPQPRGEVSVEPSATEAADSADELLTVLLIEDSPGDARLISELLSEQRLGRFRLVHVDRLATGAALATAAVDAVMLDLNLPDSQGLETFRTLHAVAPDLPIVVLSGLADGAVAMQAVREGAQDYLVKGSADGPMLERALRYAVERQRAERALRISQERLRLLAEAGVVLGSSLDDMTIFRALAELLVPVFADCCLVDVLDEPGAATCVAAVIGDLGQQDLAPMFLRQYHLPAKEADSLGVASVIRSGRSKLWPSIAAENVKAVFPPLSTSGAAALLVALRRLEPRSAMIVPVQSHGQILGAVTLLRCLQRAPFASDDLLLGEELGRRAGMAATNARLYQTARASIRARDELLGMVAHDLRSPLTVIALHVDRMLKQAGRSGSPDTQWLESLRGLKAVASGMARNLSDLLDAASVQAGHALALRVEAVDLVALVRRLTADYQRLAPNRLLRIETSLQVLSGDWDIGRLERVLANLLANATKYSPDGSEVTVSVEREADSSGQAWAILAVRDRGVGIPADELSRISTRFFRASNVIHRFPGSGIGLAGVREVVEQHGGTFSIESKENTGTTVTVRLPLATTGQQSAVQAATEDP